MLNRLIWIICQWWFLKYDDEDSFFSLWMMPSTWWTIANADPKTIFIGKDEEEFFFALNAARKSKDWLFTSFVDCLGENCCTVSSKKPSHDALVLHKHSYQWIDSWI